MAKHKLSLILSITFVGIILFSVVILSILQTNTKPNLPNPDSIKIYLKSTTASNTYSKGSDEYNKIIELYNSMFEKTYLKQLTDQELLTGSTAEDTNAEIWRDANLESGVFVEFVFDSSKKFIIERNGSTRRVDITSIYFQLTKENKSNMLYVYYKLIEPTTSGTGSNKVTIYSTTEPAYPLITQANTYELYKYVVTND